MKPRVLCALALALVLAGCAGAGPASSIAGGRPRCASSAHDEQRPLFFLFCIEGP